MDTVKEKLEATQETIASMQSALADMHQRAAQMEANLHYQRGRAAALREIIEEVQEATGELDSPRPERR